MTVQEILTAISTVGFPIFACVFMYIENKKETDAHKTEMLNLKDSIDNNTLILEKILEYFRKDNKNE